MMKNKAQSLLEYSLLISIVAAALMSMQLYFKRGIQSTIKIAADEIGTQSEGAADYDYKYDWKMKGASETISNAGGTSTTTKLNGGAVNYGKSETTRQGGLLSWGVSQEKE